MTQKELAYIEDAIGHEKTIIDVCNQTLNYLEDEKLKSFIENEINEHTKTKEQLMSKLEAKVNE